MKISKKAFSVIIVVMFVIISALIIVAIYPDEVAYIFRCAANLVAMMFVYFSDPSGTNHGGFY